MTWTRRAFLGSTVALGGCAGVPLPRFPFARGTTDAPRPDQLLVRYYSVGCCLIQRGDVGVLCDPFFSHLPVSQLAHGDCLPDPAQVDPYLGQLGDVRAVVVGHGHYDHVLDLPYLADSLHPDATVLGSQTVAHTFAPNQLPRAVQVVNGLAADGVHPGTPVELAGGLLTVLPIRSGHPDQIPGVHLFDKRLTAPRETPPTKVGEYQEGDTFAYLLDFRDHAGGPIERRVYVQTSSRGLPDGLLPASVLDEAPVDVALLAMDCARAEAAGRESIIDVLRPADVVFVHWEDFFRPKQDPPVEGAKNNMNRLRKRLVSSEATTFRFPYWDATFLF